MMGAFNHTFHQMVQPIIAHGELTQTSNFSMQTSKTWLLTHNIRVMLQGCQASTQLENQAR
jgi:hypothetical protein